MKKRIDKTLGNQFARGSLIGSIALATGYLTQYLFHASVSRTLGAETAGKLFISFAFVLLVSTVTRLGLDNTGLKVVSVNFSEGRLGNIRRIALLISLLVSLVSISVMILLLFGSSILTDLISLPDDETATSIIFLSIPLIALKS